MQQEFLTTRKPLLAIVGWIFLIGVLGLVPVAIPIPYANQLGQFIALACFALLVPILLVYLAFNYWQTMYGRRGYFTMTLPVRGRVIYWAKVCYALVIAVVGLAASLLGFVMGTVAVDLGNRRSVGTSLGEVWGSITSLYGAAVWALILIVLVQGLFFIMAVPAMFSIAAQARFNHLGVAAPVIGGVLLYLTYQVTSLAAMMFVPFGLVIEGPDAGSLVAEGMWAEIMDIVRNPQADPGAMPEILGLGMLLSAAALTIWIVWWGVRSLERRTSLR